MENQAFETKSALVGNGDHGSNAIETGSEKISESTSETMNEPEIDWAEIEALQMETFHQAVREVEFLEGSMASVDDLRNNIAYIVSNFKVRVAKLHEIVPCLYSEVKDIQESFSECYDRFTELLDKKLLEQRHNVAKCNIFIVDFRTRVSKLQKLLPSLYSEVKDIQLSLSKCEDRLLRNKKLLEKRCKIADKHLPEGEESDQSEAASSHQMSPNSSSEGETLTRVTTLDENEREKVVTDSCQEVILEGKNVVPSDSKPCDERFIKDAAEFIIEDIVTRSGPAIEDYSKQLPPVANLEPAATFFESQKTVTTMQGVTAVKKRSKYDKKRAQKAREQARDAGLLQLAIVASEEQKRDQNASSLATELATALGLWATIDTSALKYNKFNYEDYLFWVPEHNDNVPNTELCSYAIKQIKGKGDGVVAMENIAQYSRILQERFIFLVERSLYSDPDEIPSNDAIKSFLQERLIREEAEPFMRLGNIYSRKQSYLGRLRTNMELVRMEQTSGTDTSEGIPMFPTICKINHSCCPNSFFSWNRSLGCGIIYALHDIKKGEEITIAYKDIAIQDFETRKSQLDLRWGIRCNCKRCSVSVAQRKLDDKRIHKLVRELNYFEFGLHNVENEGTPILSAKILSKGKQIQNLLSKLTEQQNLTCLSAEWAPKVFYYCACAAMSHGDILRSRIFAQNAATHYGMYRGRCFAGDVMYALQANPRLHHRWGMYSTNWYQNPGNEVSQVALTVREDGEDLYVEAVAGLKARHPIMNQFAYFLSQRLTYLYDKQDEYMFKEWLYRSKYEKGGWIR